MAKKKKIIIKTTSGLPTKEAIEELTRKLAAAASVIKLVCGVGNNAAWNVVSHAMGELKQSPRYRFEVRRAFKMASTELHRYETNLVTATDNRMFHVADMSPEIRKRYGADLTDRDYYDFWKNIGATAYLKTKPLITSLQHKFALSMSQHSVKDPELVAWLITAQTCMNLAIDMYKRAIHQCQKDYDIKTTILEHVFGQFDISRVAKCWNHAMCVTAPDANDYVLEELEARNIQMGIEQLREEWISPDTLYTVTGETVADYDEIFATKGYQKKVLREIADIRADTNKELEKHKL